MAVQIYLASQSPRRRELLEQIGVNHRVLEVEIDETPQPHESAAGYVVRLAQEKATAAQRHPQVEAKPLPILAADTAVVVDGAILGKPSDRTDAVAMLLSLSDRQHEVLTGVALADDNLSHTHLSRSVVQFRQIDEEEATRYWQTGEPADKAGGYAIQGVGAIFISNLIGSYSGVMGLPIFETAELLRKAGIAPLKNN